MTKHIQGENVMIKKVVRTNRPNNSRGFDARRFREAVGPGYQAGVSSRAARHCCY